MLINFFKNPVEASKIGAGKFGNFADTHISNLKTLIPADGATLFGIPVKDILNTLIIESESSYDEWASSLSDKSTNKSMREGKTINLDDSLENLRDLVSRKAGVIADKFPRGTPVYEELYPGGVSEYKRVSKENAANIFGRFIKVLGLHKNVLGEDIFNEVNDSYNLFTTAKDEQSSSKSQVTDKIGLYQEKRRQLSVQLFKNLLTLLLINLEQPEKAAKYFDESMLAVKNSKTEEQPIVPEVK